jgi:hypothetical protein
MKPLLSLAAGLVFAGSLAGLCGLADALESYTIVASGQRFQGDVPAGSDIRIEFPLVAGSEPRISLALTGAAPNQPISFTSIKIFGPDGVEVVLPQGTFFSEKHASGKDSISFSHWIAAQSGNHQFLVHTNARVLTHVRGRLVVARTTRFPFAGDENSAPIQVSLMPGDHSSVSVTRVSGSTPKIGTYLPPAPGTLLTQVPQKKAKKGATSRSRLALSFGVHEYTIGYFAEPLAGAWKGVVHVVPFKGGSASLLRLRNSPGVPLSVFEVDRSVNPTFGGTGVGVASDGTGVILITSEQNGAVIGQRFDTNLTVFPNIPNPTTLTSASDLTTGQTLAGHRLLFLGNFYYLAFSSASGSELALARIRTDLVRDGYASIVSSSADPTTDFFLTANPSQVSVGVYQPANKGHLVTTLGATDFGTRTTATIGGPTRPQAPGAGAAWRTDDAVFELWTPDTLDYHGPSDLRRGLYNAAWTLQGTDPKLITDPVAVETMPTAVTVDPVTKATIVHYVVADNPLVGPAGSGKIHRRIFDASGVEVPGSHVIMPTPSCNRPAAAILGAMLFIGFETPSGVTVERHQLLR